MNVYGPFKRLNNENHLPSTIEEEFNNENHLPADNSTIEEELASPLSQQGRSY